MDRQQPDRKEIPVNARAVGSPMGMDVLYLEDYVHTFIKKLIKNDEDGNGCEVYLYGYEFEEEGKHFLVVSGAYQYESRYDRPEKIGVQFFTMSRYLGTAVIHSDGVSEMNMEIIREGTRSIVFKSFYIYYDQNEEMQNYLIEWNLEHRDYRGRIERENSVRYGRMAQAYNKEEVRVSFLWNAMNILSIGFVVCIMVYGIISINNYQKMKNIEDRLSYIVTTMAENKDLTQASVLLAGQSEDDKQTETEVFQTEIVEEAVAEESAITQESIEETMEAEDTNLLETASMPRYYVVQQGDTLRSICINVYGNPDRVDDVCLQNGITNPDSILYGQTLLLP